MVNKERIVCHVDTDKTDITYGSVESMTDALVAKYGLASTEQVLYKFNGSSHDILVKSKLGNTMRNIGFYYTIKD